MRRTALLYRASVLLLLFTGILSSWAIASDGESTRSQPQRQILFLSDELASQPVCEQVESPLLLGVLEVGLVPRNCPASCKDVCSAECRALGRGCRPDCTADTCDCYCNC